VIIEHRCEHGIDIVTILANRVCLDNGDELANAVMSIAEQGTGRLVIDASAVLFEDSYIGVTGLCIKALKMVHPRGGYVYLTGLQPGVQSLFKLSRMDQVFPVYDSVDAAVDAIRARFDDGELKADANGEG